MTTSSRARPVSTSLLRRSLETGLLAGIVIAFVALVGMVEAFATRDILSGVVSVGPVLVWTGYLLAGHFALRNLAADASPLETVSQGSLAGLAAAAVTALLAALIGFLPNMRQALVNATPQLFSLLTFSLGLIPGLPLLLVVGAVAGALAGGLRLAPRALAASLSGAAAWLLIFGLLQELFRVTLRSWPPTSFLSPLLFAANGMTPLGATAVGVLAFVAQFSWWTRGAQIQARYHSLPASRQRLLQIGGALVSLLVLLSLPAVLGLFFSDVLVNVGLFILMGLGLNIVVGFAGLLDLGYVAFFAIGAYSIGVLTTLSPEILFHPGLNFWLVLPVALVLSFFAGITLGVPVLKVRGDYLAIVTLGFGEIIRLLALSDFLKPFFGGARGIEAIPKPSIGPILLAGPQQLYYPILIGCLLVAFISFRVKDSRIGRAWMAVREDEDVAQAMGINLVATKLMAFAMGATFAGLGGAIFAVKLSTIYPHSFDFLISINVLALIIIGGMGSIPGVIVGALVLVGLPELLREFADYRLLVYGAVLVLMMLTRPEGLWPEQARRRELHAGEETETSEAVPDPASP